MSAFQHFSFFLLSLTPHPSPLNRRKASLFPLYALAWLWFTLINHLRVEWSVNPQYSYGWAVPFLCAYLLWRRVAQASQPAGDGGIPAAADTLSPGRKARGQWSVISGPVVLWFLAFLALLYAPTRLIQEANPEWRLVSWALALEVIGLTLLLIRLALGAGREALGASPSSQDSTMHHSLPPFQLSAFSISDFVFPICFFLVAVPWPTFIEAPLIQGLMRANIGVTIELLGVIGVPAVQHGNVIELATGMLGIDDACSGIRSLQAALMISLFLGELYALSARRRVVCVFAGFALAFVFNVGRTLLLTRVAAAKGVGAVASWHDPAGVTILVGCFLSLWLIARALRRKAESRKQKAEMGTAGSVAQASSPTSSASIPAGKFPNFPTQSSSTLRSSATEDGMFDVGPTPPSPPSSAAHFSVSAFQRFSIFLAAWLVLVEAGTELWYRSHEWRVPKTAIWHLEFPRGNPTFRELSLSDKTKQFLRYDEGFNGTWQQGSEQRWQAVFFRWNPGRIAVYLAKSHTPEVCLTAAGRELVSQSALRPVPVQGLQLPFRSYVVKDENGPLHVFYCLWDDRASAQSFRTTTMTYANRLAPVLAGRRNSGQRSLEVAIWGIANQNEAEAALARELDKLIKIEK